MANDICVKVVGDIMEADDCNWERRNVVTGNRDSRSFLSRQLRLFQTVVAIHNRFDEFSCSPAIIDKFVNDQSRNFSSQEDASEDESSTYNQRSAFSQPNIKKRRIPSTSRSERICLKEHKPNSLQNLFFSSPNIHTNTLWDDTRSCGTRSCDTRSCDTSNFSICGSSLSCISSLQITNDLDLYRTALSCIQHPPRPATCSSSLLGSSERHSICCSEGSTNKRSKKEKLKHLRKVFQIGSEKHKQYVVCHRTASCHSLHHQLRHQMRLIDRNEQPYYEPDQFQSTMAYDAWRRDELIEIKKLMQDQVLEQEESEDCVMDEPIVRSQDAYYIALVDKIIKHEASTSVSESTTSPSEGLEKYLISKTSREILQEYSVWHRLNSVSQSVIIVDQIMEARRKDCCELGDAPVLQELLRQIEILFTLVEVESKPILKREKESLNQSIDEILRDLEELLNSFLSLWKPSEIQLELALQLLVMCHRFRFRDPDISKMESQKIITDIFRKAVRIDFEERNRYEELCPGEASNINYCILLLKSVISAIRLITNAGTESYQTIFSQYIENLVTIMSDVFFKLITDKVEILKGSENLSVAWFQSQIILAFKMAELEECVTQTGYHLTRDDDLFTSWRQVFDQMTSRWIHFVIKDEQDKNKNSKIVKDCIRHNKRVVIKIHSDEESRERVRIYKHVKTRNHYDTMTSVQVDESDPIVLNDRIDDVIETDNNRKTESPFEDAGETERVRMNTLIGSTWNPSTPRSQKTTNLSASESESRISASSGSSIDGSDVTRNETLDVNCTQSVIEFIVFLNRSCKFAKDVARCLYELPQALADRKSLSVFVKEKKINFYKRVIEATEHLIKQYTSCTLNLDVCIFPRSDIHDYVSKEQLKDLRQRARTGLIDCCRHQLSSKQQCVDDVTVRNRFEEDKTFFQMILRVNNIEILRHGLQHVWNYLKSIGDVQCTSSSMTSSPQSYMPEDATNEDSSGEDDDTEDPLAQRNTSQNNDEIHEDDCGDGEDEESKHYKILIQVDIHDEPTHDEPTHDEPIHDKPTHDKPTHDEPTHDKPIHDELIHDELMHDEPTHDEPTHDEPTHDRPTHVELTHDEPTHDEPTYDKPTHDEPTHDEPTHKEPTRDKPIHDELIHDELIHDEPTHDELIRDIVNHQNNICLVDLKKEKKAQIHENDHEVDESSNHSLNLNVLIISSIIEETNSDVTICLRSLCRILAWRISRHVVKSLWATIRPANQTKVIAFLNGSLKGELDFVKKLKLTLDFLSQWVCVGVQEESKQALLEIFVKNFRKAGAIVTEATNHQDDPASSHNISSDPSISDNADIIRKVSMERNSMSGHEMLHRFMKSEEDSVEGELAAKKLCDKLFEQKMIVQIDTGSSKHPLPRLEENTEELALSMDTNIPSTSASIGTTGSTDFSYSDDTLELNESDSHSLGSEVTCFESDNNHFYKFVSQTPEQTFIQQQTSFFNTINSHDIDVEFFQRILYEGRHNEVTKGNFVQKRRSNYKLSQIFPCFGNAED